MQEFWKAKGRLRFGEMNATELEHQNNLELRKRVGEVKWYKPKPCRLILGKDTTYEPDFLVMLADDQLEFHEVKGAYISAKGRIKLHTAAQAFPVFTFKRWQKTARGWEETAVE